MLIASDLMSERLISLRDDDSLYLARQTMDMARIRHIPVVDANGMFVGLITHRDMLGAMVSKLAEIDDAAQDELFSGIPIHEVMRKDVTFISPDLPLRKAAELLLDHKYGCLPVVAENKLIGILTESDFLRLTISLMDALEQGETVTLSN